MRRSKTKLPKHEIYHYDTGSHHTRQLEPTRRCILDAVKENFRISQRITYVHRMMYVGETTTEDVGTSLKDIFDKIIKKVNDHYCDEKLTGFLFYHMRYFCHVLDGSEDTLTQHLKLLAINDTAKSELGRMKLLMVYHHVNQRMLDEWLAVTGKPPTLLEKMSADSDLKQTMEKLKYCIEKLYGLGLALRPAEILDVEEDDDVCSSSSYMQKGGTINMYGQMVNPIYPFLPELSVLEFLLNSHYMRDLPEYVKSHGDIPFMEFYGDLAWPVPCDHVPMNVFLQDIDPITDLTIEVPP